MNRKANAVITTACIGLAAGTAAYMMSTNSRQMNKKTKRLKKNTSKALHQVGEYIDNMSYMMR